MGDEQLHSVLRWEVRADHMDMDRWAQAIVNVAGANKKRDAPPVTRWGNWPVIAVAAVVLAVLVAESGGRVILAALVPVAAVIGGVLWLNRTTAKRLAKRLRDIPAASEPFTFVADPEGTHSTSPSSTADLAWGRYKAAALDGDLVLLTLDNDTVLVLPVAAITSGQAPAEAVTLISSWIDRAPS